jgi:tetratricopeptide (TPR) repeat protein
MNTSTLQEAISASAQGDSNTALALFSQAASEQPNSGVPHLLMGAEHAKLGEIDKAEAGFANALLLEPGLLIARYQLGLLQLSSARAAIALVTWQPLLQLDDSNPLPHFVRGFEALAHDQFDEASRCFQAGLVRNVDNPPLSNDIRKVLEKIDAIQAPSHQPPTDAEPEASEVDFHFLLSNYQQKGPGH